LGQVQGEVAAAVAGGPCGDVDQVAADGGAPGSGVERCCAPPLTAGGSRWLLLLLSRLLSAL